MIPFEHQVDTRNANKDSFRTDLMSVTLPSSKPAIDRQFLCGTVYVEPVVPISRERHMGEPASFHDTIQGVSQRPMSSDIGMKWNTHDMPIMDHSRV